MSIMIYNSVATKEVKPDIVNIKILINEKSDLAKDAINKLNENRNFIKNYILDKTSYRPDSYHQMDVDLNKQIYKETYYVNDNGHEISVKDYDALHQSYKNQYTRKVRDKFLYYEASLTLEATLNYGETTVIDLMDIFNACVAKDLKCYYNHNISNELQNSTMQELYTECINKGVLAVNQIVSGLDFCYNRIVNLLEVRDPAATSTPTQYERGNMIAKSCSYMEDIGSNYTPEQVIMPELLEELFNNNIKLKKSLDLTLEF